MKVNIIKLTMLIICLTFSILLPADPFNSIDCIAPEDQTITDACETAKAIDVPLMKVMISLMPTAIESTALSCSFTLTKSYHEMKKKLLQDEDISKAFDVTFYMAKLSPPLEFSRNPKEFCKKRYELFGPDNINKKGPNGGPSSVFFK